MPPDDKAQPLFCLVYGDEQGWSGSSVVRFDVRRPDAAFLHFVVEQPVPLNRESALAQLLAKVRQRYPEARLQESTNRVYITLGS